MQALKAQVRNGRFVIDEGTGLPEGTQVELQLVPLDSTADMPAAERAEFLREVEASGAEADAGQLIDAAEVLAKLRAPA